MTPLVINEFKIKKKKKKKMNNEKSSLINKQE